VRQLAQLSQYVFSAIEIKSLQNQLSLLLVSAALLLIFTSAAEAHEIKPAIVDLNFKQGTSDTNSRVDGNQLSIVMVVNLESLMADIGPDHKDTDTSENSNYYKTLRALGDKALRAEFESFQETLLSEINLTDSLENKIPLTLKSILIPAIGDINNPRDTKLTLQSSLAENTVALSWQWSSSFGEVIVRANSDSIPLDYAALLSSGQRSDLIQFTEESTLSIWQVLRNYIVVGFEHILPKGLDHILFVVGVFLLTPAWRPIAIQVTLFTLAHSITLALSVNGVLSVSAAIVEPLIALSIVVVCVENYFTDRLTKWRIATVFIFGLLHGLGFASVLGAVGLDSKNFVIALLGFNLGVEIGQLLIIAICMLGIGMWFGKQANYRKLLSIPASVIVGSVGLFWFVQRITGLA
jgi:hydrogenase/urease accessory protein HupE